jgi:hypothetical protein
MRKLMSIYVPIVCNDTHPNKNCPQNSWEQNYKIKRCVIHNGLAINLISTIDIYDKLFIAMGK